MIQFRLPTSLKQEGEGAYIHVPLSHILYIKAYFSPFDGNSVILGISNPNWAPKEIEIDHAIDEVLTLMKQEKLNDLR